SVHAVLLDPAGVSGDLAFDGRLLLPSRFSTLSASGCSCHEAQSLHLCYGLDIALSTLNSCRCLHESKTRFPVGRLFPFSGRESHPLKAPGLSWRTEEATNVCIEHPVHSLPLDAHGQRVQRLMRAAAGTEPVREALEVDLVDLVENRHHSLLNDLVLQGCDA